MKKQKWFLVLAGLLAIVLALTGCDELLEDDADDDEKERTYTVYTATTTISEYNAKLASDSNFSSTYTLTKGYYIYYTNNDAFETNSSTFKSFFDWNPKSWTENQIREKLSDLGIETEEIDSFIKGGTAGFAVGQTSGSAYLVFRFSNATNIGETKAYLTISVKDSTSNSSIGNATVEIRNAAGTTLKTFYTDASGSLTISFPGTSAVYTVVIKKDGYGQKTKTITVSNGQISDGNISVSLVNISKYNSGTATSFSSLADDTGGITTYSVGPADLTDCIETIFNQLGGGSDAELVLAIDATGSMSNDIEQLRKDLIPAVREVAQKFGSFRIGLILYRDDTSFGSSYVKRFDFTTNLTIFESNLNGFTVGGGKGYGAVYEALYSSMTSYNWTSSQRRIVLIGDAPPRANSTYSREYIVQMATQRNLPIDVIILPE